MRREEELKGRRGPRELDEEMEIEPKGTRLGDGEEGKMEWELNVFVEGTRWKGQRQEGRGSRERRQVSPPRALGGAVHEAGRQAAPAAAAGTSGWALDWTDWTPWTPPNSLTASEFNQPPTKK